MSDLLKIVEKEGDFKEWLYKTESGITYKCRIIRNKHIKHLCGYVILTKDDIYYGKSTDDIPVVVHGGLTFSNMYEDEWMVGFDCAHHGDITPGCGYEHLSFMGVYRDMDYVKSECEMLAEQLSEFSISRTRNLKIDRLTKE